MPLFRRSKKIKRIIYSKISDARDEKVRFIQKEYEKAVAALPEEEQGFKVNDLDFNRRLKIREVIKEVIESKKKTYLARKWKLC